MADINQCKSCYKYHIKVECPFCKRKEDERESKLKEILENNWISKLKYYIYSKLEE